jgi:hypothetical protein
MKRPAPNRMEAHLIDTEGLRDIAAAALDASGRLRVMPASFWEATTAQERAVFGVTHGLYHFPTVELVDYLRRIIDGRRAIEIGAGAGILAEALGIPATDNRMQEWPNIQRMYRATKQPVIRYGQNVEPLDALVAINRHRPQVVIAAWVTHKFDAKAPEREGNMYGVDERKVVRAAEYVFVGNEYVHRNKPIWAFPHTKEQPPCVFSRAINGSPDFVARWARQT